MSGGQNVKRVLIHAASAADHRGEISPAAILLEEDGIVHMGSPQEVGQVDGATEVDATDSVVLPGLVNAHAHLDLSGPGPRDFEGDFDVWLDEVIDLRLGMDEQDIQAAVQKGAALSLAGGTAFIGDIAGAPRWIQRTALQATALGGVSFAEYFGLGDQQKQTIESMAAQLAQAGQVRERIVCGLSPHAPYTCGPEVIAAAAGSGVPVAIHVAECPEEYEFLELGTGPFRDKAKRLGAWNQSVKIPGRAPVGWTLDCLGGHRALLIHLNYLIDGDLERLADSDATAVYCPRASAYFGHPRTGEHPYRALLDHGVPVALGTDSLLCLDTPGRISTLDEMRLLHRRDGVEAITLLTMATTLGATALGVDASLVDLTPGPIGGLFALRGSSLAEALRSMEPPRWLVSP